MKKQALTAREATYFKADPERTVEVPAGPPGGLYLTVHPSGKKSWALRYRYRGRPRRLTLKRGLTLAEARGEAVAKLKQLEEGHDPAARPEPEPESPPNSFEDVAGEFLKRKVEGTRTAREVRRIVEREAVTRWGKRPFHDVGRADVLRALDELMDRESPAMANKAASVFKRLWNWADDRGIPCEPLVAKLKKPAPERSRERVLTDEELAAVWQAAGNVGYPFGPFIRLLILTAQRRGELAAMTWGDVDEGEALWTLPRTKAGRAHDVPLSGPALEILEGLPRFEGAYVFTTTSGKKPLAGWSKLKARLDRALKAQGADVKRWTLHDLRRTAATRMAAMNVPPHVLAAILNHSPGRTMGISAVYIRHRYLAERREALAAWGAHVLELVEAPARVTLAR